MIIQTLTYPYSVTFKKSERLLSGDEAKKEIIFRTGPFNNFIQNLLKRPMKGFTHAPTEPQAAKSKPVTRIASVYQDTTASSAF